MYLLLLFSCRMKGWALERVLPKRGSLALSKKPWCAHAAAFFAEGNIVLKTECRSTLQTWISFLQLDSHRFVYRILEIVVGKGHFTPQNILQKLEEWTRRRTILDLILTNRINHWMGQWGKSSQNFGGKWPWNTGTIVWEVGGMLTETCTVGPLAFVRVLFAEPPQMPKTG